VKLVIKRTDAGGRLELIRKYLRTPWDIEVVDPADYRSFAAVLKDADAILSMSWSAHMPPAPALRLLHLPGAGTDEIDFLTVPKQATVCNAYEHETGIAEYVLATILEWTIGVRRMEAQFRRGVWHGSFMCGPFHGELFGKVVGIVGYGRIGRAVAQRVAAFGTRVIACSRRPRPGDEFVEKVHGMEWFHNLLGEADFVVIAAPLTEGTKALFDAEAFRAMKPSGVVVNVARGAIIHERALYDACRERRIGGAVIDTWYNYPEPGQREAAPSAYPFHELDNVVMTPHASAWTEALLPRRCCVIAENLDRLARGQNLINIVKAPA
jgi:phosphoglycerate dehydrogenase-like enzyme